MAEIIQFLSVLAAFERDFREIVQDLDLSPETTGWVRRDMWPRIKDLVQGWKIVNFEGHDEANRTNKEITNSNLLMATAQILKLEIELYEARFGKSAARL